MQRLFTTASSSTFRDISIDSFHHLDSFEVYPFPIPDLSSECPLILSGRCQGKFPDSLRLNGVLVDMTNSVIDMKVQKSKDIPLDKSQADKQKLTVESTGMQKVKKTLSWKDGGSKEDRTMVLNASTTVGFGNVIATKENATPFIEEKKAESNEVLKKVSICCTRLGYCCCPCFVRVCSRVSDQCAIAMAQLCAALSCLGCIKFCMEICFECN